jgi:transmembrane sensor
MKKEQFLTLIDKYLNNSATEEEKLLVENYYSALESFEIDNLEIAEEDLAKEKIFNKIQQTIEIGEKRGNKIIKPYFKWISIAAAILIVLSMGIYITNALKKQQAPIDYASKIKAGGDKAILTLSNGKKIVLGNGANKSISDGEHTTIVNISAGLLKYDKAGSSKGNDNKEIFNKIETPRGGRYKVILSDGTVVWLNAFSTLKFPVEFKGKQRKVELTGEAYFEVAPNKNNRFVVATTKENVEVFGTHFNINAYDDEPAIKTTLLEGKVLVKNNSTGKSDFLKPGEQSTLIGNNLRINEVDVLQAIDWKNEKFIFKEEDINSIMRKLSRWYDVDVEYPKQIDDLLFTGKLSRTKDLKDILTLISKTKDVKFNIIERRVIVTK